MSDETSDMPPPGLCWLRPPLRGLRRRGERVKRNIEHEMFSEYILRDSLRVSFASAVQAAASSGSKAIATELVVD